MSPIPQIVGIGELLWDLLPGGARLGGTTTNFSVFCARLGNRAVLVSSVGDDQHGKNAHSLLVQPNLDLQLQLDPAHATGTVNAAAKTFEMTAKEVGGQGRTATINGSVRSDGWLVANINGPGIKCQSVTVQWYAPYQGAG